MISAGVAKILEDSKKGTRRVVHGKYTFGDVTFKEKRTAICGIDSDRSDKLYMKNMIIRDGQ